MSRKVVSLANQITAKLGEIQSRRKKINLHAAAVSVVLLFALVYVVAVMLTSGPYPPAESHPKKASEASRETESSAAPSLADAGSATPSVDELTELRNATKVNPRDEEAWVRLGTNLAYRASTDEASSLEALDAYERALALDPNNAEALKGMGDLHFDRHEYKDAIPFFTKYLTKDDDANVYLRLGLSLYMVSIFGLAIPQLKAAIGSGISSFGAYTAIGDAYFRTGDLVRARAALKKAERITPDEKRKNVVKTNPRRGGKTSRRD